MTEIGRVGSYEPVTAIGTGGMATVYLARAPIAGGVCREVALKLVHPHLRESEEASSTLIEEAKLAARIRHPNVVAVREVGEAAAGIFLVMDYVEGATLSKLVRTARQRGEDVPLPIAGRILTDALAGLHAAHELSDDSGSPLHLVHRDFSPQNVLVGLDGVTRLTDFGIAKAASRAGVTSTGVVKGKVGYMSPEQALGRPLDRKSDIWAAGIVAWELLAGRRLYDADAEPISAIMRIVSEIPPRLGTVRPELSPLLEQAVATALSLEPLRRWPNADELSRALAEGFRTHGGIAEAEDVGEWVRGLVGDELEARRSGQRRTRRSSKRARRARPGLIAVALLGIASIAFGAWAMSKPAPREQASVRAAPPPVEITPLVAVEPAPQSVAPRPAAEPAPRASTRRAPAPRPKRKPSLGPNPYREP